MKTIGLAYILASCNDEPPSDHALEIEINDDGSINSVFVNGNDMTDKGAVEMLLELLGDAGLTRITEKHFPEPSQTFDQWAQRRYGAL
jgi:hypothetical protein